MQEVTERTSTASGMDELRKTVRTAAESKETVEPYDGCYEETDTRVGLKDGLNFVHVHSLVKHIHDYNRLSTKRNQLLLYIFLLLVFIGLNFALLAATFQDQHVIEERYFLEYHLAGFWGVFGFTILEGIILTATGLVTFDDTAQSSLLLFNVCSTFATALFVTFDPELFEVPAHYMEYSIQLLVSGVNILFINQSASPRQRTIERVVLCLVMGLSVLQLALYSGQPPVAMGPERSAHFCEFTTEIFNGLFALLYALQCYKEVQANISSHALVMRSRSLFKRTKCY